MKSAKPKSVFLVLLAFAALTYGMPVDAQHSLGNGPVTAKVAETDAALQDLWLGHVFWVRNVVMATMTDNRLAADAAEKQVVNNASQIAHAVEPFYGKPAADKLFGLLAKHYGAVKQYLDATVADSQARQQAAVRDLTDNADQIAAFLSGANPNLPFDAVKGMLVVHGSHHIRQIQELRAKQYAEEAQTWGAMKDHMYALADTLAAALAKQFPAKF